MNVVVRSERAPDALTSRGRRAIRALDPDAADVRRCRTMAERVDESLARRRFSMLLLTLFAALALGAGGDRHLRRDGVSRHAGHARDGHPPGARRDARAAFCAGRASGAMVALAGVALGLAGAFVLTRFMRPALRHVRGSR